MLVQQPHPARRRTMAVALATIAVVCLGGLTGCTPSLGKPALKQAANAPRVFDNSDPAVLVVGTKVYLFGSSNNMKVPAREITSFSGSLIDSQTAWARSPRDAMATRPAWVDTAEPLIWAPTFTKIDQKYVMWFAAHRAGAVDESNDQCIGRATANSPMGPYTPGTAPIYCGLKAERGSNPWGRGALDPEVFRDPSGKLYLALALSRTTDNIGVVALDATGYVVGGSNATPKTLASRRYEWHDGVVNGTLGSPAFLENPSMVYEPHTKTYLLFYSAGQWNSSKYLTGFARCGSPTGPCVLDSRGPFLQAGSGRSGVGGLTVFKDGGGTLRVAYASWMAGQETRTGSAGVYSRQTHFAVLSVGTTTSAASQVVSLK